MNCIMLIYYLIIPVGVRGTSQQLKQSLPWRACSQI